MNFHSILATITDLSPQGNRAVLRAAVLAAQQRALLKIMYAPWDLGGSINTDVAQDVKRLSAAICARFILVKNETGDSRAVCGSGAFRRALRFRSGALDDDCAPGSHDCDRPERRYRLSCLKR